MKVDLKRELAAANERIAELEKEVDRCRSNWLTYQDLTGEQCMDVALPMVAGWKEDAARWQMHKHVMDTTDEYEYLVGRLFDATADEYEIAIDVAMKEGEK